uniref:C. briggsae CBR-PQN-83 protein n=1 Tax=Haemonchus contortus TaxID=6289 RepID=W6NFU5_HAECO
MFRFRSGSGLGSRSSSSSFLSSLAGGALGAMGGMLMFEAGRAIIQSMGSPFRYGGRDYYFDNHPGVGRDQIQCSIPIDELKQVDAALGGVGICVQL